VLTENHGCRSGDMKLAALLDEDGQLAFLPAHIKRLESHTYQGELELPRLKDSCSASTVLLVHRASTQK